MGKSRKPWRIKFREYVAMTRKDAADFTIALKQAFPDIRFVPRDYKRKWSEHWRWAPVINEMRAHGYRSFNPPLERDPTGDSLVYYESLAVPQEQRFIGWLEPPEWEPRWEWEETSAGYWLENEPTRYFEYDRSTYNYDPDECQPPNTEVINVLSGERVIGFWYPDDSEAKAFVQKLFRILTKLTTNQFRPVDRRTLRPLPWVQSETHMWAGYDAVRWAHERRHNYLVSRLKPADYDFGDETFASEEELAAFAEREAVERRRIAEGKW